MQKGESVLIIDTDVLIWHLRGNEKAKEFIRTQVGSSRREQVLRNAAGIWKDRVDIPDFNTIRAEWDRN